MFHRHGISLVLICTCGLCVAATPAPEAVTPAPSRLGASIDLIWGLCHRDPHAVETGAIDLANAELTHALKSPLAKKMRAALPPVISDDARALYMDKPDLIDVNPEQFGGESVYFVNGIASPKSAAIEEAKALSRQIKRPVQLLYNPCAGRGDDMLLRDTGMAIDVAMCIYQRSWPLHSHADQTRPQKDPVTRQLTSLLVSARGNVTIITHSQGCLIMRNALLTATRISGGQLNANIDWIATGTPLRDEELYPRPRKLRVIANNEDPIAEQIGLRFDKERFSAKSLAAHDFVKAYVGQIELDK